MVRAREPPNGPEPDYTCPNCGSGVKGNTCGNCGLDADEAEEKFKKEMALKVSHFEQMLEEQDPHGFGPDQLSEISHEGRSIKVVPRFRVSMTTVLKLPGVRDATYVSNGTTGNPYLLVKYEPDEESAGPALEHYIEKVQVLANRHGPHRAARMVSLFLSDPERYKETYEPDSTESLAVKAIARHREYDR